MTCMKVTSPDILNRTMKKGLIGLLYKKEGGSHLLGTATLKQDNSDLCLGETVHLNL